MAVIPELLGRELSLLQAVPTTPLPRPDAVDVGSLLKAPHEEVVYFIANGGRVKIGYSTNLRSRLSALSLRKNNVLAALAGGTELEQVLHAHFAEHRQGNTEWFELAPEIVRYISETSKNPRPASPKEEAEEVVEVGSALIDPLPQEARSVSREAPADILSRALQVLDDLNTDRITREQLAQRLTGGDEELLRAYMRQAGAGTPHSMRIGGLPVRGWYRSNFEEALTLALA